MEIKIGNRGSVLLCSYPFSVFIYEKHYRDGYEYSMAHTDQLSILAGGAMSPKALSKLLVLRNKRNFNIFVDFFKKHSKVFFRGYN